MIALALLIAAAPAADFSATIRAAKPGSTITAPAGPIRVALTKAVFAKPVTIVGGRYESIELNDSSGVRFVGITLTPNAKPSRGTAIYLARSSKITFSGGSVRGDGLTFNGANLTDCQDVTFESMAFSNLVNGIRGLRITGATIASNTFTSITADSVAFGGVRDLTVRGNTMRNPVTNRNPHPDAVQVWDDATFPSSDILIERNTIDSQSQGIFVKSEGRGGFDRVSVLDNDVTVAYSHGITVTEGRGTIISGNRVRAVPGSRQVAGKQALVWPWVKATGDAVACGNVVAPLASRYGTEPCK